MAVGVAARWSLVVPGDRVLVTPAGPDAHHFSTRPPGQSPAGRVFLSRTPGHLRRRRAHVHTAGRIARADDKSARGRRLRDWSVAMDMEPLDAASAVAGVLTLVYEVAKDVYRHLKGRKARKRMVREGVSDKKPPENK